MKITTQEMEVTLARHFDYRQNIIVPNISWGAFIWHECDLFIISKNGYCTEIEIKISKGDLLKDQQKKHNHTSDKIKNLYFAIPTKLINLIECIPEQAGIIEVYENTNKTYSWEHNFYCSVKKEPTPNKNARPLTEKEIFNVARLGTMRIWNLKEKLNKIKKPDSVKDKDEIIGDKPE